MSESTPSVNAEEHQGPRITIAEDGPFVLSGDVRITRRRKVTSDQGEPLTWETTERLADGDGAWLCRCGGSSNKPYCDDTHLTNGFDGTAAAAPTTYAERAKKLGGERIVVRDDRSICEHAGFCSNKLTNVWRMAAGDADADVVTRTAMVGMIANCPSGALTYALVDDGPAVEQQLAPGVAVVADGPLFVSGGVEVRLADGTAYEPRNRMTLCRCGQSNNKPFCDGTHAAVDFHDGG